MRTISALKHDIAFQFRHGFYYIYAIVSILYIVILNFIPSGIKENVAVFIILSDPSILGFFFIGGIVLLEKEQFIFQSIFTTPLRIHEYINSKLISLTILGCITSLIIAFFSIGIKCNFILLFVGVFLSSSLVTLLGLIVVVQVKNINQYILASPMYITIFLIPVLEYTGIYNTPLFYLIPGKPAIVMINNALKNVVSVDSFYSIVVLVIWIIILYYLTLKSFRKFIFGRVMEASE